MFTISSIPINRDEFISHLENDQSGALVLFEGWVRNHNQGKDVTSLEYQVYKELALKEGYRLIQEAKEKFNILEAKVIHREGHLSIGDLAICIGSIAAHRDDAFKATRYLIDEIKRRLPIWKKEHYKNEKPIWVFCKDHDHHVHFEESEFYKKQSALVEQEKLTKAKVIVVGAGGLGCPVLISLSQAGIGTIEIVDFDKISFSNIHRQSLFSPNLVGEYKAIVAKNRLQEMNPFINIKTQTQRVEASNVINLIQEKDLVIDCTDNLETKYLLHDACLKTGTALISGSVFKRDGVLRTFIPNSDWGCLRCHSNSTPKDSLLGNCNDFGVLGAYVNILGSMMASEALQYLQHRTNTSHTHTILLSAHNLQVSKIKNSKRVDCQYCRGFFEIENSPDFEISKDELTSQHQLLDIRELNEEDIEPYLNSKEPVVLCCHRGIRSKILTTHLRDKGYQHFFSLKGGSCSL